MGEVECCHCQGWPTLAEINFSNLSVCLELTSETADAGEEGGQNTTTNYHRVSTIWGTKPSFLKTNFSWGWSSSLSMWPCEGPHHDGPFPNLELIVEAWVLANPPTDINCMQFWSRRDKLVVKLRPATATSATCSQRAEVEMNNDSACWDNSIRLHFSSLSSLTAPLTQYPASQDNTTNTINTTNTTNITILTLIDKIRLIKGFQFFQLSISCSHKV